MPATPDRLGATVEGDVEAIDRVLRVTRIRVRYRLAAPAARRAAAERAVARHAAGCPAFNSVRGCIDVDIQAAITELP